MARRYARYAAVACLVGAMGWLYGHVLAKLVHDWATDGNYSHGFLVPPVAGYFAWERRARLASLRLEPSFWGLCIVAGSLAVLVLGTLGAELFLTRISLIGLLAGAIVFTAGWRHLRTLAFPLVCLVLMIPIPAIVFNQIAFPLQLIASQFGAGVLSAAGIPVLREGNVIVLANTSLEVAEACSGIRSLVSLLTIGLILGYFSSPSTWVRAVVTLGTIPIAIFTNALRVAGTGIAAHFYGPRAAEGFFHTFSGWLVFLVALLLVWLLERACHGLEQTTPQPSMAW